MKKLSGPLKAPALERSISLFQATVYGVGIILGAGIYALIGEAVGISGNAVWLSFLVPALIAGCSAIAYAKLTSVFLKSVFVKEKTGSPFLGFLVGYVTLALNVGWFPVLPFLGVLFCTGMLFTQFWQPITVLGMSIPVILYALLITFLAVPIYRLNKICQR